MIIRTCHGCRRLRTTAYVAPIPNQLPPDRTNCRRSLDFSGLVIYEGRKDSLKQASVLLINYSLSRVIHLELVCSQKVEECIRAFKRFVARQGRPARRYSDKAKAYKATAT